MPFALPDWVELDYDAIARDARLDAAQIDTQIDDDAELSAEIERHATELAPTLIGRVKRAAGSLGFPLKADRLAVAVPAEYADDATEEEIAEAEELAAAERATLTTEKSAALAQALRELILARLYKVQPGEDPTRIAQQHADGRGAGMTGSARLGSGEATMTALEDELIDLRNRYHILNGNAFS